MTLTNVNEGRWVTEVLSMCEWTETQMLCLLLIVDVVACCKRSTRVSIANETHVAAQIAAGGVLEDFGFLQRKEASTARQLVCRVQARQEVICED